MRTFLNNNTAGNLTEIAKKALESREEDFEVFFNIAMSEDDYVYSHTGSWTDDDDEKIAQIQDIGSFYEYGLEFTFVPADEDNEQAYYKHLLAWGGPSEEVRFYADGSTHFVYMDWFCGTAIVPCGGSVLHELRSYFEDCFFIDFESKDYSELYYETFEDEDEE